MKRSRPKHDNNTRLKVERHGGRLAVLDEPEELQVQQTVPDARWMGLVDGARVGKLLLHALEHRNLLLERRSLSLDHPTPSACKSAYGSTDGGEQPRLRDLVELAVKDGFAHQRALGLVRELLYAWRLDERITTITYPA